MTEPAKGGRVRISLTRTRRQTVHYYLTSPVFVVLAGVALVTAVVTPVVASAYGPADILEAASIRAKVTSTIPTTSTSAPPLTTWIAAETTARSTTAPEIAVSLVVGSLTALRITIPSATTVRTLLDERGITLGADDTVSPDTGHVLADGDNVVVTQVRFETSTDDTVLPQPEPRTVTDDTLTKGVSVIAQQGHPGVERVHYRTKVVNGVPGDREVVSRETITEPLATITKVGTKVAPQPLSTTAARPTTSAPPTSSTPAAVAQERVVTIACETAATVQVTVTGPGDVSLALDPGGSWSGDGKVTGDATLTGPGSVKATFTGTYYTVSALGGVCS